MSRCACTVLAVLAGLATFSQADRPAEEGKVQEVVCFTETGPVLLRVKLQGEFGAAEARWKEFLPRWFAYLDRDGDGRLSEAEFNRAPSPEMVREQWRSGLYPRLGAASANFRAADADRDGFVSLAEMDRYYRLGGAGPLNLVVTAPDDGRSEALTARLFAALDRDGDGKLSKQELAGAVAALRRFDINEDELLTPEELLPTPPRPAPARVAEKPVFVPMPGSSERAEQAAALAHELLRRYDRDGDGRLSAAEIGLSTERFRALDRNRDTRLSAEELAGFLDGPADLTLAVSSGSEAITVSVGRRMRVGVATLPGQPSLAEGVRQFFRQQFALVDRAGRGSVTLADLERPELASLRALFPLADRDEDGRLTEKELLRSLDLYARWLGVPVTLTVSGRRSGLFELLDADGDGRLSLRDLKTAPARLLAWDRNGDGFLTPDELPPAFELDWSIGPPARRPAPRSRPRDETLPSWFLLMDTNGDGDVSEGEFIGSVEEFRRLDTNGDGLISPAEARAVRPSPPLPKDR
jgi:Ca2+-binding EF-hand superfamily protein